jgi:predicted metalloprotease
LIGLVALSIPIQRRKPGGIGIERQPGGREEAQMTWGGSSRSRTRTLAVAGVLAAAAAACAQEVDTNPLVTAGGPSELPGEEPETPQTVHEVIEAAINDIRIYWEQTFPEVYGEPFEDLQGGYHPYGPDTEMPPCGSPPPQYEEIANNAFYCPEEDLIAWDEATLMPELAEQFGPFTVGVVLAHEFGHAVQPRGGVPADLPTILFENQADCFAGAWTRWIAEGNSGDFSVDEDTLDATLAGIISFSDAPGTEAADPMAHGLGFDRVSAFQDGWENSATKCAEYPDNPPQTVEIPFSQGDLETGGNMSLEDEGGQEGLFTLIERNLNLYYDLLFQDLGQTWTPVEDLKVVDPSSDEVTCDGETLSGEDLEFASLYCEQENIVVLDGEGLVQQLNDDIGDFAVGAEVTRLYSRAAQVQLGVQGDDLNTSLQADCLTGVWAADNFPDPETGTSPLEERVGEDNEDVGLVLSAGDLDEAIMGFLTYGDTLEEQTGTAFERARALRTGFLPPGLDACQEAYGALSGG